MIIIIITSISEFLPVIQVYVCRCLRDLSTWTSHRCLGHRASKLSSAVRDLFSVLRSLPWGVFKSETWTLSSTLSVFSLYFCNLWPMLVFWLSYYPGPSSSSQTVRLLMHHLIRPADDCNLPRFPAYPLLSDHFSLPPQKWSFKV